MPSDPIGVIGAGLMGHAIAQVFATAGHPVNVVDNRPDAFDAAREKIERNLALLVEYEVLDQAAADAAPSRISFGTDLAAVSDAAMVIESVTEDPEAKNRLFHELSRLLAPATVITTNTSSIPLSVMAEATGRPDRFATSHFFRPGYIIPMVEVSRGAQTSEATIDTVVHLLRGAGRRPIRINADLPGQAANRLRQALFREALDLVERGVVSAEDIDELAALSFGQRLPLFGVIKDRDLVGLEITLKGADCIWPDLARTDRAHDSLRALVDAGSFGLKSGRGFFDWSHVDFAEYWESMERKQLEIDRTLRKIGAMPT